MKSVSFEAYNVNPKGIVNAADCVIRAIAYASCQSWEKVANDLTELALKEKRVLNEKHVYEKYLSQLGFEKHKQPKMMNGCKFTCYETYLFADTYEYDVVVSVPHHLTCLDNGKIIDTWNCGNKCVGNYWTRPKTGAPRPANNLKGKKA